jgi:hypothetical protein
MCTQTPIKDMPTTELLKLESQLRAEILALTPDSTMKEALTTMFMVDILAKVRRTLKGRTETS